MNGSSDRQPLHLMSFVVRFSAPGSVPFPETLPLYKFTSLSLLSKDILMDADIRIGVPCIHPAVFGSSSDSEYYVFSPHF